MINLRKVLKSKKVEVTYLTPEVDKEFVKDFRKKFDLTQTALANTLGVTKKTVEKWEQGINKVSGSSAILFRLLSMNPELIQQLYAVSNDISKSEIENSKEKMRTMKSTEVGYVNKNNQKNNGRTNIPGTGNGQWFYDMECLNCGHKYYANGHDIWLRKCPKCQGGRP